MFRVKIIHREYKPYVLTYAMATFYPSILERKRYEAMDLFKVIMETLQRDEIPHGFNTYAELIKESLP